MASFEENLQTLPPIDDLDRLELFPADGYEPDWVIENKPGQTGSLAVYYKIAIDYGGVGPTAARHGLELFAEKAEEARANPGQHPNIDKLIAIADGEEYYSVRAVPKGH